MTDAIKHRGPDQTGIRLVDRIALGFTRLSILDLEHGSQPISNEDQSLWLVFNGEIYNYQSLKENLKTLVIRLKRTQILKSSYIYMRSIRNIV